MGKLKGATALYAEHKWIDFHPPLHAKSTGRQLGAKLQHSRAGGERALRLHVLRAFPEDLP